MKLGKIIHAMLVTTLASSLTLFGAGCSQEQINHLKNPAGFSLDSSLKEQIAQTKTQATTAWENGGAIYDELVEKLVAAAGEQADEAVIITKIDTLVKEHKGSKKIRDVLQFFDQFNGQHYNIKTWDGTLAAADKLAKEKTAYNLHSLLELYFTQTAEKGQAVNVNPNYVSPISLAEEVLELAKLGQSKKLSQTELEENIKRFYSFSASMETLSAVTKALGFVLEGEGGEKESRLDKLTLLTTLNEITQPALLGPKIETLSSIIAAQKKHKLSQQEMAGLFYAICPEGKAFVIPYKEAFDVLNKMENLKAEDITFLLQQKRSGSFDERIKAITPLLGLKETLEMMRKHAESSEFILSGDAVSREEMLKQLHAAKAENINKICQLAKVVQSQEKKEGLLSIIYAKKIVDEYGLPYDAESTYALVQTVKEVTDEDHFAVLALLAKNLKKPEPSAALTNWTLKLFMELSQSKLRKETFPMIAQLLEKMSVRSITRIEKLNELRSLFFTIKNNSAYRNEETIEKISAAAQVYFDFIAQTRTDISLLEEIILTLHSHSLGDETSMHYATALSNIQKNINGKVHLPLVKRSLNALLEGHGNEKKYNAKQLMELAVKNATYRALLLEQGLPEEVNVLGKEFAALQSAPERVNLADINKSAKYAGKFVTLIAKPTKYSSFPSEKCKIITLLLEEDNDFVMGYVRTTDAELEKRVADAVTKNVTIGVTGKVCDTNFAIAKVEIAGKEYRVKE